MSASSHRSKLFKRNFDNDKAKGIRAAALEAERRAARLGIVRSSRAEGAKRLLDQIASPAFNLTKKELKGLDTDLVRASGMHEGNPLALVNTVDDNTMIMPVNLIGAGSGSWQRVGRKVSLHSIRLSGRFSLRSSPMAVPEEAAFYPVRDNVIRWAIVWDRQPSGALPKWSDIFGRTVQDGNETSYVLDPLRYDNTERFRVLKDERISMNPGTFSALSPDVNVLSHSVNSYLMLNGRETVFSGNNDPMTIADISSGALYVVWRVISGDVAARIVPGQFICRLRYSD